MAIEIKPKNIFDRELSRLNNNIITNVINLDNELASEIESIYSGSTIFYKETETNGIYKYVIERSKLEADGFIILENITNLSGEYTMVYKRIAYSVDDGNEYDYDGLGHIELDTGLTLSSTYSHKITEESYDPAETYQSDVGSTLDALNTDDVENTIKSYASAGNTGVFANLSESNRSVLVCYIYFTILTKYLADNSLLYLVRTSNCSVNIRTYTLETEKQQANITGFDLNKNELFLDTNILEERISGTERNDLSIYNYEESVVEYSSTQKVIYINFGVRSNENVASELQVSVELDLIPNISVYATIKKYTTLTMPQNRNYVSAGTIVIQGQDADNLLEYGHTHSIFITNTTPKYDSTYTYFGDKIQVSDFIADKIEHNYSTGKQTAVIECSIDDYYDEQGNKVISKRGSDNLPMIFKNNDIVYPKRVRMKNENGTMVQEEVDFSNGKRFRVVGVKVKYDGCVMQELTLQEEKS